MKFLFYFSFRSLRTSSNVFIINLSIANLLMSLIDFPLLIIASFYHDWPFGQTGTCRPSLKEKKKQNKTKQIPVSILIKHTHIMGIFSPHYRRKSNYITYIDITIGFIRRRQSRYDIFENIHVLDPFHFVLGFAAATECLLVTMTCRRHCLLQLMMLL